MVLPLRFHYMLLKSIIDAWWMQRPLVMYGCERV